MHCCSQLLRIHVWFVTSSFFRFYTLKPVDDCRDSQQCTQLNSIQTMTVFLSKTDVRLLKRTTTLWRKLLKYFIILTNSYTLAKSKHLIVAYFQLPPTWSCFSRKRRYDTTGHHRTPVLYTLWVRNGNARTQTLLFALLYVAYVHFGVLESTFGGDRLFKVHVYDVSCSIHQYV